MTDIAFSNRLTVLAAEIKALHTASEEALQTSIEKATEAGKLLIEAKTEVPHGQWLPWLKKIGISVRTAQRYMQLSRVKYDTVSHLGIKAALAEVAQRRSKPLQILDLLHATSDILDELATLQKPTDTGSLEYGVYLAKRIRLWGGHTLEDDRDYSDSPPGYLDLACAIRRILNTKTEHDDDIEDIDEMREVVALQQEVSGKAERLLTGSPKKARA